VVNLQEDFMAANLHDRVPGGFRRSTTSKGWLKPTATTLRQQRIAAENRDLKAAITELQGQMAQLINPPSPGESNE